jgi:uncharacterized protein YbaR (Trm112 family)
MNPMLFRLLACTRCKGEVEEEKGRLICRRCKLAFPVRDGIPDMIIEHARGIGDGQGDTCEL